MMNLAHRGASTYAPENTMAAFYKAIELGANGIEIDLRMTKDHHIVIVHDDTVDRTTNGKGLVKELTLAELGELDAGSWFSEKYAGEKIVTFKDFMTYFYEKELYLAIELKDKFIETEVLSIIQSFKVNPDLITVTSFDYTNLERMRLLSDSIRLGYLTDKVTPENINKVKHIKGDQICVDVTKLEEDDVRFARKHNLEIRTWRTENEHLMLHAMKCGVDGMTINFPDKLADAMKISLIH